MAFVNLRKRGYTRRGDKPPVRVAIYRAGQKNPIFRIAVDESVAEKAGFNAGDKVELLWGMDDHAGQLLLRRSKGEGGARAYVWNLKYGARDWWICTMRTPPHIDPSVSGVVAAKSYQVSDGSLWIELPQAILEKK